jgi:hypothetical protein
MRKMLLCIVVTLLMLFPGCSNGVSSTDKSGGVSSADKAPRGTRIAFSYHPPNTEDCAFLSRFDIVVTHDLLGEKIVQSLKSRGAKVVFYEWLPAFYYGENPTPWQRYVYQNKDKWILDPDDSAPDPMGERYNCKDFFYDMADRDLMEERVEHLAAASREAGYDGVFFDWGSGWHSLVEQKYDFLTAEYTRRHQAMAYDDAVSLFLDKLRKKGLLVILNGGFRSEGARLDAHADADVVESMFTTDQCESGYEIAAGTTEKIRGCDTCFNDIRQAVERAGELPRKAAAANPGIRFLFLNYAFPFWREAEKSSYFLSSTGKYVAKEPDRQAIFYSLALSCLGGASGFTNGPDVTLSFVKDPVYFESIGVPVRDVERLADTVWSRAYSSGIVVVSGADGEMEITVAPGVSEILDLYSGKKIPVINGKARIGFKSEAYPSGKRHPVGRIFRYAP